MDGRLVEGEPISAELYAQYGRAALLEASGEDVGAEAAFVGLTRSAPQWPESWIHLGALRCRRMATDTEEAFARAEALAPEATLLWQQRARCSQRRGDLSGAQRHAERAFALAPADPEGVLLLAELEAELGHFERAEALLSELTRELPKRRWVWLKLQDVARRHGSRPLLHRCAVALAQLDAEAAPPVLFPLPAP